MQTYKPVEVNDKATKQFQADRKKVGLTGVPDYGKYTGYITCDLAITALEQMGKNVTREDFAPKFRALGKYDAAGLNCRPYDVGLDTFGKFPETGCIYGTAGEERQVRRREQGQAGDRQARRRAGRARGEPHREPARHHDGAGLLTSGAAAPPPLRTGPRSDPGPPSRRARALGSRAMHRDREIAVSVGRSTIAALARVLGGTT